MSGRRWVYLLFDCRRISSAEAVGRMIAAEIEVQPNTGMWDFSQKST